MELSDEMDVAESMGTAVADLENQKWGVHKAEDVAQGISQASK